MSYAVVWPEGVENFLEVFKLLKNYYYNNKAAHQQVDDKKIKRHGALIAREDRLKTFHGPLHRVGFLFVLSIHL
jgi:hypothetical protein